MRFIDRLGLDMSAPDLAAVQAWDDLVTAYLQHARTVPQMLVDLLARDPESPLGWAAKALMMVAQARKELNAVASDAARNALAFSRDGTRRERLYAAAAIKAAAGEWNAALVLLREISGRFPDDSFCAKMAHSLYFMLGDRQGLLSSVADIRKQMALGHPHAGYILGCEAFANEELGQYERAEKLGRKAIEVAPKDAWGLHAVAHVLEMTGRGREGVEFLGSRETNFAHCGNFGFHVVWHLALFHLGQGDTARALELYDTRVRAEKTDDFRDIANAVSLLTRLELCNVDVGDRWDELVLLADRRAADRCLVFADLHYALALARAGRTDRIELMFEAGAERTVEQTGVSSEVGAAMAKGIAAFMDGRFGEASRDLLKAQAGAQTLGGSHAQRDVFEQITIEATLRAGDAALTRRLLDERFARRGEGDSFGRREMRALTARLGGSEGGVAAGAAFLFRPVMD